MYQQKTEFAPAIVAVAIGAVLVIIGLFLPALTCEDLDYYRSDACDGEETLPLADLEAFDTSTAAGINRNLAAIPLALAAVAAVYAAMRRGGSASIGTLLVFVTAFTFWLIFDAIDRGSNPDAELALGYGWGVIGFGVFIVFGGGMRVHQLYKETRYNAFTQSGLSWGEFNAQEQRGKSAAGIAALGLLVFIGGAFVPTQEFTGDPDEWEFSTALFDVSNFELDDSDALRGSIQRNDSGIIIVLMGIAALTLAANLRGTEAFLFVGGGYTLSLYQMFNDRYFGELGPAWYMFAGGLALMGAAMFFYQIAQGSRIEPQAQAYGGGPPGYRPPQPGGNYPGQQPYGPQQPPYGQQPYGQSPQPWQQQQQPPPPYGQQPYGQSPPAPQPWQQQQQPYGQSPQPWQQQQPPPQQPPPYGQSPPAPQPWQQPPQQQPPYGQSPPAPQPGQQQPPAYGPPAGREVSPPAPGLNFQQPPPPSPPPQSPPPADTVPRDRSDESAQPLPLWPNQGQPPIQPDSPDQEESSSEDPPSFEK